MEPIDISSSDSDVEISGAVETYRSLNGSYQSTVSSRSIAPDAVGPSRYFVDAGYMGNPQKLPNPRRAQASERSSSNGDHSSSVKHKRLTTYIDTPRNSLSENVGKGVLSSSLPLYAPRNNSVKIGENRTGHLTPSIREKLHYSHVPGSTDQRNHMDGRDRYNMDDVVMLDSKRSRILPPTLMHGKASSASPFASTSDSVYRSTVNNNYRPMAENEGGDGYDEQLIMRAVIEDINQPVLEAELPHGLLSVDLLRHQKIALAWWWYSGR